MEDEFVDFYSVLGLRSTATADEITRAYRQKCREHHPDRTENPRSHQLQKLINLAYETLSDPQKRAAFDQALRERNAMPSGLPSAPRPNRSSQTSPSQPTHPLTARAPEPSPSSRGFFRLAVLLAAVIVLASAAITAFRRPNTKAETQAADESKIAERKKVLEDEEALVELEAKAAKRKQDSALAVAKLKGLELAGNKVLAAVKDLDAEIDKWDAEVRPLLSNERGKLIASGDDEVRAFQAIWSQKRPTKVDAKAIRERVTLAMSPVTDELKKKEPLNVPGEELAIFLVTETTSIEELAEQVRGARLQVANLLSTAELAPRTSTVNLEQAIKNLATREIQERNTKLAEIERQNKEKIAAAEAKLKEEEGAAKLGAIEAKTERTKLDAAAEAEHQRLLQKAKSAETRALLSFFFTPGYRQPDGSQTTEKVPVSYSKLDAAGCLDPTPQGQRSLLLIMIEPLDKDRPIWNEKVYVELLSEAKRERLGKIQKALIELGPALVELKLLGP